MNQVLSDGSTSLTEERLVPEPLSVSVVVPCNHSLKELRVLLAAIRKGSRTPNEIIVVLSRVEQLDQEPEDSSGTPIFESTLVEDLNGSGISLRVIRVEHAYPGEKRNIGFRNSSGSVIAFLDVKTIPTEHWLSDACSLLADPSVQGVLGELILGSPMDVPHITKFVIVAFPVTYLLLRGIYLPLKKGVPIKQISPFRFLILTTIAFSLDLIKLLALISPLRRRKRLL